MAVLSPAEEPPFAAKVHPGMSLLLSPPGQLSPAAGPLLPGSAWGAPCCLGSALRAL